MILPDLNPGTSESRNGSECSLDPVLLWVENRIRELAEELGDVDRDLEIQQRLGERMREGLSTRE
jgi:hypothetical protein